MPSRQKVRDAIPKGSGVSGHTPKARTVPLLSRNGHAFCDCQTTLEPILDSHKPGKAEPIESLIHNGFLTLPVPQLASLVARKRLEIVSRRACIYIAKSKSLSIDLQQKYQQVTREAEEKKKLEEEEKQRQREAAKFAKKAAENAIGFLSFKYGRSVEDRQKIGHWPAYVLLAKSAASATTSLLIGGKRGRLTRAGSIVARRSFDKPSHPSIERPGISPILTKISIFQFAPGIHPPLTPADSNDSRRQSLLYAPVSGSYEGGPGSMADTARPDTTNGVEDSMKGVIQELFTLQQHVSAFRTENQERLNHQVEEVGRSIGRLEEVVTLPNNPLNNVNVAPEIIDYVDDGRNPDIFTRDFVELVQRGNAVLNGKQKAFKDFSKIFATKLKDAFDGMDDEIDLIMGDAGMEERDGEWIDKGLQNGSGNKNSNGDGNGA